MKRGNLFLFLFLTSILFVSGCGQSMSPSSSEERYQDESINKECRGSSNDCNYAGGTSDTSSCSGSCSCGCKKKNGYEFLN